MMVDSISELEIGKVYDWGELFALSDFFIEGANVAFGSVTDNACFRAGLVDEDKWAIKEIWNKPQELREK